MVSFKGSFPKENITYENSVSDALKVVVLAIVPTTDLPVRDDTGKAITTFKASEELIRGAISSFRGGVFNVNHDSIPETMIGVFDSAIYDDGFKVSGSILCPQWKERIQVGDYTGVSVEGNLAGDMTNPDSISIYAISFLTDNPGACPLGTDTEGNPACEVVVTSPVEGSDPNHVHLNDQLTTIESPPQSTIEAAWKPNYDSFWSYIEDKNGKISQGKAKRIFLKKTGTGENRTDWHYPFAHMTDSGPEPDEDGLMAAYKRAAQQGETGLFSRIRSLMRRVGMEIPDGLKASKPKLEASFDKNSGKFSAKTIDEDGSILSEKEIIVENIFEGAKEMPEDPKIVDKPGAETDPAVAAQAASPAQVVTDPVVDPAIAAANPAPSTPLIEPVIQDMPEAKPDVWSTLKEKFGIADEAQLTQLKDSAAKVPEMEGKLNEALKELGILRDYKVEQTKNWLTSTYPPAVTKDIAATYAEYIKDPAAFTQKYQDDAVKFAASKEVAFKGSSVESPLTEEARKNAERKTKRDSYLKRTGGPVRR